MLNTPAGQTPPPTRLPDRSPEFNAMGKELLWQYGGDLRFFLVVGQVAILQMMHPAFTAVVADNSVFYADVWRRWFERTQPMLQKAVFDDDAEAVAHEIRNFHNDLRGVDDQGRTWHALNPQVFHFAHATQYHSLWRMIEIFADHTLTDEETEAYYQATRKIWAQFGMRMDVSPPDWPSFITTMDKFYIEQLENTDGAHEMIDFLASAPPPPIKFLPQSLWRLTMGPAFDFYVKVQVGLLPPEARQILGYPEWTDEDEEWLRKVGRRVAFVCNHTPNAIWLTPQGRKGRYGRSRRPLDVLEYAVGEAVHRPIQAFWRAATRVSASDQTGVIDEISQTPLTRDITTSIRVPS